ncbi:hypothetical protein GY45DRAFT_1074891 [Cubamyces sp. BRFM 1775]|nr:hypothetical protein GY45DRAFT_1074891 [Cubamyces sp. BRFM 1775]
MGERFQVYLIARGPARTPKRLSYQCIGAYHHQWCFETMPLRALHRFFTLLQQDENAAVVRDELRLQARAPGDVKPPLYNPAVPCPYTLSLLSISWTTDLEQQTFLSSNSFTAGLMDAREPCWAKARQIMNDEGICVIDITDLKRPAYCFVSKPGGPPLSAYQYLREHASGAFRMIQPGDPAEETDHKKEWVKGRLIDALDAFWSLVELGGRPLIPVETLREVWPTETFADTPGHKQLKVPESEDLPMPLDIIVSLYLGLASPADLETLKSDFECSECHEAVGKVILPPYEPQGTFEGTRQRVNTVARLLSDPRPFEYVLDPPPYRESLMAPAYFATIDAETLLYWTLEHERLEGAPPKPPLDSFLSESSDALDLLHAWLAQPSLQRIAHILHPAKALQLLLQACGPIPDSLVDMLAYALKELGVGHFLDLSDHILSTEQVLLVASKFPDIEALSLSWNFALEEGDILRIISDLPSLRRLHVMHFKGPDVQELVLENPEPFYQLESLLCPLFLVCPGAECPRPHVPVSFAFMYLTRATSDPPPWVSLPFCTPAQIVQALIDILPLAFCEHEYGESVRLWKDDTFFMTRVRAGPNEFTMPSNGFPFYMTASMLIHATLSCAARKPGELWSERRIVSMPLQDLLNLPRNRGEILGTWTFCFDWDHRRKGRSDPGKNCWGFVHYEVLNKRPETEPDGVPESEPKDGPSCTTIGSVDIPESADANVKMAVFGWQILPGAKVYDLRGFLRCMADEGRPLPDEDAIKRLEQILDTRDPVTGELVCPLLGEGEAPEMQLFPLTKTQREKKLDMRYPAQRSGNLPNLFVGSVGNGLSWIAA